MTKLNAKENKRKLEIAEDMNAALRRLRFSQNTAEIMGAGEAFYQLHQDIYKLCVRAEKRASCKKGAVNE